RVRRPPPRGCRPHRRRQPRHVGQRRPGRRPQAHRGDRAGWCSRGRAGEPRRLVPGEHAGPRPRALRALPPALARQRPRGDGRDPQDVVESRLRSERGSGADHGADADHRLHRGRHPHAGDGLEGGRTDSGREIPRGAHGSLHGGRDARRVRRAGGALPEECVMDYKTLVQDDRIHATLYTDPRIFDDEMERIFRRGWVFVGHDSEIASPGDFVTRRVGTEPVIMVRGKDGGVAVLVNRCMHRGTMVCPADRGSARTFTCPYHGWTYDISGELLGVPYPGGYATFDKSAHGLTRAPRVSSYRGFVLRASAPRASHSPSTWDRRPG